MIKPNRNQCRNPISNKFKAFKSIKSTGINSEIKFQAFEWLKLTEINSKIQYHFDLKLLNQ